MELARRAPPAQGKTRNAIASDGSIALVAGLPDAVRVIDRLAIGALPDARISVTPEGEALVLTQPTTLDQALFEAVSAFSTAGYTLGLTPRLNVFGRLLIALTMFLGRVGVLTLVVALARRASEPAVRYPEEQLLIG